MNTKAQAIPDLEQTFAVKQASDDNHDIFTNVNPLWCVPGLNAVYGGLLMSQALNAGMQRVSPAFVVHSMHCHFIKVTKVGSPVLYYVVQISQGKSSTVYTVSAWQNDQLVLTATMSFRRIPSSPVGNILRHAVSKPKFALDDASEIHRSGGGTARSLFEFRREAASSIGKSTS
ncbi:hypothetical protein AbraIFM66950_001168 [Aspergillus brasiliensis]|nr:hypothetical protein AbraIFM66950_001168 [Aspergillus brasiliensis]